MKPERYAEDGFFEVPIALLNHLKACALAGVPGFGVCRCAGRGFTKHVHIHVSPHALGETIGMAAEIAHGSCTDVPPQGGG